MPTDVIKKVFGRDGNRPGAVVFATGEKLTTFSDAELQTAEQNLGQMVSYTTVRKGQYTNLGTITPLGTVTPLGGGAAAAGPPPPAPAPILAAPPAPAVDLVARKLLERQAVALEALGTAVASMADSLRAIASSAGGAAQAQAPDGAQPAGLPPTADPIVARQEKLASAIGADAAAAMFAAIRKRHKAEAALLAAADELLQAHGVA